jgi:hypothetical protein
MRDLLDKAMAHESAFIWVSCISAVMFVGSLLLVPWLVARAPADFFVREEQPKRHGAKLLYAILRNLLGVVLLVAGVLMLVLPGQGLLVVLLGVSLLDVPGKHELVRRMAKKKPVWRALAYLRERAHKPPFERP